MPRQGGQPPPAPAKAPLRGSKSRVQLRCRRPERGEKDSHTPGVLDSPPSRLLDKGLCLAALLPHPPDPGAQQTQTQLPFLEPLSYDVPGTMLSTSQKLWPF